MNEIQQLRELNEALRKTATHYIDRTIKAEAEVERLKAELAEAQNKVDTLTTTTNMYCAPYYAEKERADKAEAELKRSQDLLARLRRDRTEDIALMEETTKAQKLGLATIAKLQAELTEAHAANAGLREALEEVEWLDYSMGDEYDLQECPCCEENRLVGHSEDCKIGQALASPAPGVERLRKLEAVAEAVPKLLRDCCSPCLFGETTDCRGKECRIHIARRILRKILTALEVPHD